MRSFPELLYNVHMARLTASEARRQFFHLLDAAERGEPVVVERRGVRFRVSVEIEEEVVEEVRSPLIIEDPSILSGQWTWSADERGELQFVPREDER